MSDGYRPYVVPVDQRENWIKGASYLELQEAADWALLAHKAAEEDWQAFVKGLAEFGEGKVRDR